MRKTLTFFLASLVATAALAQVRTPRPSPKASLTQTVGTTDVSIVYSRPGVKGRSVWGGLVPYGQVWRTGANEPTVITFSEDVSINGQALKKGSYSIHTIPGQSEWSIIFNSAADPNGNYSYDKAKDVLTVKATPQKADFREWLTFEAPAMTVDDATFHIRWENVAVPFTVSTDSTKRALTALKNSMKPSWQTPLQAASLAFDNPGVATDAEINAWVDESIRINETANNLWLKARVQHRAGQTAEAKKTAERAIAKATPQQSGLVDLIKRDSANWK
jgi:Protein of unknown function (DUF2911)